MKKLSPLIPCWMLLSLSLIACQNPNGIPAGAPADATSSVNDSASVSTTEDLLSQVRLWLPGIQWSSNERGTFDYDIPGDAQTVIPSNTVQGTFMSGTKWNSTWYSAVEKNIIQDGWNPYASLNVDGPDSGRWGYEKKTGDSMQFLIFSNIGSDCTTIDTERATCKNHETRVFYTDPIGKDQFVSNR